MSYHFREASFCLQELKIVTDNAAQLSCCKRKAVGCSIVTFRGTKFPKSIHRSFNGPSGPFVCTNEIGNCGCMHAEVRAILQFLKDGVGRGTNNVMICTYSPCKPCTNAIIESGLFCGVIRDIKTENYPCGEEMLKKHFGHSYLTRQELSLFLSGSQDPDLMQSALHVNDAMILWS